MQMEVARTVCSFCLETVSLILHYVCFSSLVDITCILSEILIVVDSMFCISMFDHGIWSGCFVFSAR